MPVCVDYAPLYFCLSRNGGHTGPKGCATVYHEDTMDNIEVQGILLKIRQVARVPSTLRHLARRLLY